MTDPTPISAPPSAGDLLDIVQDLSQYLDFQKKTGAFRLDLSPETLDTLTSWGQNFSARAGFRSQGPASAAVVLVDGQDIFFTGEAGQLLIKILAAMNLSPDTVSICNAPDPVLVQRHVRSVRPRVVIALGEQAARVMTGSKTPLAALRGQVFDFQGIPVMPTFHPKQLVADPALKRPVWEDLQQVMKLGGIG
jgi:hypothetical protein